MRCYGLILLWFFSCFCFSCTQKKAYGEGKSEFSIKRFDVELFNYLMKRSTEDSLLMNNKIFLDIFGDRVIHIGKSDSIAFFERLNAFFSEPTLMSLYKDEQKQFGNIEVFENELDKAFEILLHEFPNLKMPRVYLHVSGLNQNVVVTDSILSLSADKYLGSQYPLYQDFFYDYQRQNMTPERVVPDYLLGYLMANFHEGSEFEILLERMVYEGKLRYILSCLMPERKPWEFVGYTEKQHIWCVDNRSKIWKTILSNDHLYTSKYRIMTHYFDEAPYTAALSPESPGQVGVWLGLQIVNSYMKNFPKTSLLELIKNTDAKQFLKDSKYKP